MHQNEKEQHTSPAVGLSDEAIIEGLRNRDPQITRDYFYGVCRIDAKTFSPENTLSFAAQIPPTMEPACTGAVPHARLAPLILYPMKKFLFIFLSCLLFQQLTAQTIVKFDNGNNIIYKNLQGKTIVKNKKYTIAFTDTISSIGFVGTRKGEIVCINNAGKELFEVYKIDNGPDYVSDGLFRIVGKNGKIGFADTCGVIVIPPVFSYATPFHNEEAKVSFGGKNEKQGEYQSWKSNFWLVIKKSK